MLNKIAVVISLLLCAGSVSATKYYVDGPGGAGVGGNDANNGTSVSTPWLTMRKACSTVVAGDTVLIRSGSYDETSLEVGSSPANSSNTQVGAVPINDGDSATGRYIVLKGYPGEERPIMVGKSIAQHGIPRSALLLDKGQHHIIWDSIHFHGGETGIMLRDDVAPHHLIFRNLIVDSSWMSDDDNNGGFTMYVSGYNGRPNGPAQRNILIENCEIFAPGSAFHNSYIDQNMSGIHVYACDSCTFRNNIIHDAANGIALKYGARFSEIYGNIIYNTEHAMMDIFHGTDATPGGLSYGGPDQVSGVKWHHNIVYRSGVCISITTRSTSGSYPDSLLYFYNNTCDCGGPYITSQYLNGTGVNTRFGGFSHSYIFNNIFYNVATASWADAEDHRGAITFGNALMTPVGIYDDYNLFYSSTGVTNFYASTGTFYTLAGWRAANLAWLRGTVDNGFYSSGTPGTQGDNSVIANPLFVNQAARNYNLQAGSPALTGGKGGAFTFYPGYANKQHTVTLDTYFGALGVSAGDTALYITPGTGNEGGSVSFTVTLVSTTGALSTNLTFNFTTTTGTALSNLDYEAQTSQQYTLLAGLTSRTISVTTYTDALTEGDETFTGTISNPSLGRIGGAAAIGTIVDVPVTPSVDGKYLRNFRDW